MANMELMWRRTAARALTRCDTLQTWWKQLREDWLLELANKEWNEARECLRLADVCARKEHAQ